LRGKIIYNFKIHLAPALYPEEHTSLRERNYKPPQSPLSHWERDGVRENYKSE